MVLITLLKGTEVTQMLMVQGDGLCCFSFILAPRTVFLAIFPSQFLEESNDVIICSAVVNFHLCPRASSW